MSDIDRRVDKLRSAQRASKGIRIFTETPDGYFEGTYAGDDCDGRWTADEVSALADTGWTVIKIVYDSEYFKGGRHA